MRPDEALIDAARRGDEAGVRDALAAGAAIDAVDAQGWSAVMWAARRHCLPLLKRLAAAGANLALRDGHNHDACDISAQHYQEDRAASEAVRDFLREHPAYQTQRGALTEQARDLARVIARTFGGRLRTQRVAYLNAEFEVRARHRELACCFRVFAGGFELWVQGFRLGIGGFSLNREDEDVQPAPRFASPPLLPHPDLSAAQLAALRANAQACEAMTRLALACHEWLVVTQGQARLRCRVTEPLAMRARLDALADLLGALARPLPMPLLAPARLVFGKADGAHPHRHGGASDSGLACPQCGEPFMRIAALSTTDPLLAGIAWQGETIEIACCFGCVLPEAAGASFVRYQDDAQVLGTPQGQAVGEPVRWRQRAFALAPGRATARGADRVGGEPVWLQSDATPACPCCGEPMRFLAQFVSTQSRMIGADMGAAYAFVCPPCRVVGTIVQSG